MLFVCLFFMLFYSIPQSYSINFSVNCSTVCLPVENIYSTEESECNFTCKKKSCFSGCLNWRKSINSSCEIICGGSDERFHHEEGVIECTFGCVVAMQAYSDMFKGEMGKFDAPQLISGTIDFSSVGLRWGERMKKVEDIHYLIQYREGRNSSEWEYYEPETLLSTEQIIIRNLKPYTKYQFRIAVVLFPNQFPFFSAESSWISTLPSGPPQSPPSNVHAVALDCSRIEVTWNAPIYPGGALITYTIYLETLNENHKLRKDISINKARRFIATQLVPNTTYEIKITATNSNGEGPPARVQATTYPSTSVSEDKKGFLLLTSEHKILKLGMDIMEQPLLIFTTTPDKPFTGLGVHIDLGLVYACNSIGSIYQLHLPSKSERVFRTSKALEGICEDISVDWLYGYLYIVARIKIGNSSSKNWQIWRCDLMGNGLTLVIRKLTHFPKNIKADPYNGYLWWISEEMDSLLYRHPISKRKDSELDIKSEVIFRGLSLSAFVLDYQNFRVFAASQKNNTILEVSLDGTSVKNFRSNTQQPFLNIVNSLAYLNGKFFWTNSMEVFSEELNADIFYHNSYAFFSTGSFDHLLAVHKSGQPVPVPLNPPLNVQVLFTKESANIMWKTPQTPALMGGGAWQEWNYEIYVKDGKKLIHRTGVSEKMFYLSGLKDDTVYSVKVRAYSKSGAGPWSTFFRGRTLTSACSETKLLWKTNDELVLTNLDGSNSTVINYQKTIEEDINHITFLNDTFISSQNGSCHLINSVNGNVTEILGMRNIYSTAYDWATNRIYGIEYQNKRIKWLSMRDKVSGHLGFLTSARELKIDSFRGYLYWRTRHQVYKSSLTGKNLTEIHRENILSEKIVHGLAIDANKSELWWIVKNSKEYHLYRKYIDGQDTSENVVKKAMEKGAKEGSLFYLTERLLWVTEDEEIIIYDTVLETSATITSSKVNIHFIALQLRPAYSPKELDSLGFLPEAIEFSSVRTDGDWEDFFITWNAVPSPPLQQLNSKLIHKIPENFYGDLRYHVIITGENEKGVYVTKENRIKVPFFVDPYSPLTVSIKGITNWGESEATIVKLRSPSSTPSKPVNIRAFINVSKVGKSVIIRWDPPINPNGHIQKYIINVCFPKYNECSTSQVNETEFVIKLTATDMERGPLKDLIFKVKGITNAGEGSSNFIRIQQLDKLKALPKILLANSSSLVSYDADLKTCKHINITHSSFRSVTYEVEKEQVFWMDNRFDVFHSHIRSERQTSRISRLGGVGNFLSYNWINDSIFWVEESTNGSFLIKEYSIIFKREKTVNIILERRFLPKGLIASPFTNFLYVLGEVSQTSVLLAVDTSTGDLFDFFDSSRSRNIEGCSCPKSSSLANGYAVDSSNPKSISLYVSLKKGTFEGFSSSDILVVDSSGCSCFSIIHLSDFGHDWCDVLTVDAFYVYCYESSSETLFWFPKEGVKTKTDFSQTYLGFQPSIVIPISYLTQPLPELNCLVISNHSKSAILMRSDENSLTLNVDDPPLPPENCPTTSFPTCHYIFYYGPMKSNDSKSCLKNVSYCHILESERKIVTIKDLTPFTKYVVRVGYQTHFNTKFNISLFQRISTFFETKAKVPTGITLLKAVPVSPDEIKLSFEAPLGLPIEVHWKSGEFGMEFAKRVSVKKEKQHSLILDNLKPNIFYQFWVRVFALEDEKIFADSSKVSAMTLPDPPKLTLVEESSESLKLLWVSPSALNIIRHAVEYQLEGDIYWNSTNIEESQPGRPYYYYFEHLHPASSYYFKLALIYNYSDYKIYRWPKGSFFQFNTSGDVPSPPGPVWLQQSDLGPSDLGWKAWWTEANSNGCPIISYELQFAMQQSDSIENLNLSFTTVYNDTENYWVINLNDFDASSKYIFRVRGINDLGAGKWSSQNIVMPLVSSSKLDTVHVPTILGATIPTFIMSFIILLSCLTMSIRRADRKRRKAKTISLVVQPTSRAHEMELASLSNQNNNFGSEENVLYNMQSFPGEEIDLPRISRNSITLTKFLGSGAFGEVFEGNATDLPGRPGITKIAIKTLRKGATENEKCEFVKEAKLMSHFQHDHILCLLAVCTDHDPFFLILELMEGGDLLSYLRANRGVESGLTLLDLLHMCLDVAKGCVYLEEMHFVHRDLAARNCLVSSKNISQLTVKIGDFGLARDIYKNDYYRKEGEGLLPVRWMSPESLIDGVFTTQSDVWAFGVLLWEILTLGQQPYPARTNLEVLHYVRNGGKPSRPPSSPEELYNLMQKCWNYSPGNRPTFKECLSVLQIIEEETASLPALTVHNAHYLSSNGYRGLDNFAFCCEREDTLSPISELFLPSWNNEEEINSASGASTLPLNVPLQVQQQYLHLVSDKDEASVSCLISSILDSDLYEKPITLLDAASESINFRDGFSGDYNCIGFSAEGCKRETASCRASYSLEESSNAPSFRIPLGLENNSSKDLIPLTLDSFYECCPTSVLNESFLPLSKNIISDCRNIRCSKLKDSDHKTCPLFCQRNSTSYSAPSSPKNLKLINKQFLPEMEPSSTLTFTSTRSHEDIESNHYSKLLNSNHRQESRVNKVGFDRLYGSLENVNINGSKRSLVDHSFTNIFRNPKRNNHISVSLMSFASSPPIEMSDCLSRLLPNDCTEAFNSLMKTECIEQVSSHSPIFHMDSKEICSVEPNELYEIPDSHNNNNVNT